MELGVTALVAEGDSVLTNKVGIFAEDGLGESPPTSLSKSSSFTEEAPMVDVIGSCAIPNEVVHKKRHSLPRSFNLKNVVSAMKRKGKQPVETMSEIKLSPDIPLEGSKTSRQIYFSKVFDRVSHGTTRMWSSIGKTFTLATTDNIPDGLDDHKPGSSKTLGRLFGRARVRDMPDDIPSAQSRTQTLGRRISSSLKLIKPTKN